MAEVLGLVASGLSIAQVAGSILTASLKLKALLHEVKNAPQSLRDIIDHIEILTPILCEAATNDDESAGTVPPLLPAASPLRKALQKSLTKCQAAGEELEMLARGLESQICAADGGARRKRAMVKVVLKKGMLAQYEERLQRTIQLLHLAQSTYVMALQRAQPEIIVSQLMSALAQPAQSVQGPQSIPHDQSPPHQLHDSSTVTGRRISTRRNASAWHECLQLGFAKVTGLVRIHTRTNAKNCQTINSEQDRVLRIQMQMPTWLCASALDAVFSRSFAGWDCSLNMYGYLRIDSEEFKLAWSAFRNDDVRAIHRLFQERRCGPMDRLLWRKTQQEQSLFSYALGVGAWQASKYLLDCGVDQPTTIALGWLDSASVESITDLESLLRHDELNDEVRMSCLVSCWDDVNSFTGLVDRLWPYDEFYTAAFQDKRLCLAMVVVLKAGFHPPSPAVFQHLCSSTSLEEAGKDITTSFLSCIIYGLGRIAWYNQNDESEWYSAIRDFALRLHKASVISEQQLLTFEAFSTSVLFEIVFEASMRELPYLDLGAQRTRQHKIRPRLATCERTIHMWLNILQECGIDLQEYGRQARQRLKAQENGHEFEIFRDVLHEWPNTCKGNGLFEIRLIGFEYGMQQEDWKLWWSEPTDGLVGDFWREVEPEPLCMPGSWDEDFTF